MKLGVAIHLGPLLNDKLLNWAVDLRASGISHCCYANAPVDTIAAAKGDTSAMQAWAAKVSEQLTALAALDMSVGVRPMPMILEQIKIVPPPTSVDSGDFPTPDFIARNTSLDAAKLLLPMLGNHNIVVQHECHDTSNADVRNWAVRRLGPATTFYYGFQGLWNKYGKDFPTKDITHTVHVALNAAGAGDASAPGAFPSPAACTPKDIRLAAEKLVERCVDVYWGGLWRLHVHINVLDTTPVDTMKEMIWAAALGCRPHVIMLRSVFGANDPRGKEGNTLTDPVAPRQHLVTTNVLQAIKECAAWMT